MLSNIHNLKLIKQTAFPVAYYNGDTVCCMECGSVLFLLKKLLGHSIFWLLELFTGKAWTWWRACLGYLRWASMSRWSSCLVSQSSIAQICWCWHYYRSPHPGTHCATSLSLPLCPYFWATTPTLPSSCTTPGMDRLVMCLRVSAHWFPVSYLSLYSWLCV